MDEITVINTDHMQPPEVGDDLYTNRSKVVRQVQGEVEVSIVIMAYNRLEKTKRCVSSVLQYTKGINYELILVDNGSEDQTLDYFKSIEHKHKKIIHITKNIGAGFPYLHLLLSNIGEFYVALANDIVVTTNWISNMLHCIKSDPRIGMVNPMTSNVSNLQGIEFTYQTLEEMQQKAKQHNISDPCKWEDRIRLITLGTLFRKEALLTIGWPISDMGFFHDFVDDDISFRIRRAGYRTVLAGDTWICHDHDYQNGEGKEPTEFQRSLEIGKQNFRDKYFGVDAWDDVCNYYIPYLSRLPSPPEHRRCAVLGVDIRCGTPILDIKNWLRKHNIFEAELSAFVQDAKYWIDLKTICKGTVLCDREEFLRDAFLPENFDYVVADRPLNRYHEPQKFLNDLFFLCKKDGVIICKLINTFNFRTYLNLLGERAVYNQEFAYDIPPETLQNAILKQGEIQAILPIGFELGGEAQDSLKALIPSGFSSQQRNELIQRMQCREFVFIVRKTSAKD